MIAALYVDRRGPLAARFLDKVDKSGPVPVHVRGIGKCWVWTASLDRKGYGQIMVSPGNLQRAHRVSWVLHVGELWPGACVLHRCDNRKCVNPDHLFLGSIADNNRDMVAKGRNATRTPSADDIARLMAAAPRGETHYAKTQPHRLARGSRHGNTTLTEVDVAAIRQARRSGESLRAIATRFAITEGSVSAIAHRRTWRHVP